MEYVIDSRDFKWKGPAGQRFAIIWEDNAKPLVPSGAAFEEDSAQTET